MKTGLNCGTAAQLCTYTGAVFSQMESVTKPYLGPRMGVYREHIGAHLRHIIEHYGAFAHALATSERCSDLVCTVDYDARERNIHIETDPAVALDQIAVLKRRFEALDLPQMAQAVEVHTRGGLQGEQNFITLSSVARELMFLNSHSTHHFAIVQGYAHQRGETLGDGFGKAPSTVAHEQRQKLNVTGAAA